MREIIVASTNPAKIKAAELGYAIIYPGQKFTFRGEKAPSGVSNQPTSRRESFTGALNRAQNAKAAFPQATDWVGLEGGVQDTSLGMLSVVSVVIIHENLIGFGEPGSYQLPEEIAKLVRQGIELGKADDIVFKRKNSKQGDGSIGILTHGAIDRATYYSRAVALALIKIINPDLYHL